MRFNGTTRMFFRGRAGVCMMLGGLLLGASAQTARAVRPVLRAALHTPVPAQLGGLGGMAAGKVLGQFHLPSSPGDLLEFVLEYTLKQRITTTLPLKLNATTAYPTVEEGALPGGSFATKPVALRAEALSAPLPPGDYEVPVMAFCTQYSVHRAGQGTAYKLAPVEGTESEAIATLLWRGTLLGKSPQALQATNWAIQAGVTYGNMPKPYQALIDELVPEYRDHLKGNTLQVVQTTYQEVTGDPRRFVQSYIRENYKANVPLVLLPKIAVPAPPLETVLARMGAVGHLMLDAKKQSEIFQSSYTTRERGEQVLFEGQGEQLPPEPATTGPWTARVPGRAYLRFVVRSGNMHGDNLMQIRILPGTGVASASPARSPLVLASYAEPSASKAAETPEADAASPAPTSLYGLLGVKTMGSGPKTLVASGVIGYSVGGGGAQALIPVLEKTGPALQATPRELIRSDVAPHRSRIGLGEVVDLTLSGATASSWSFQPEAAGRLSKQSGASSTFTAYDKAGPVTITAVTDKGPQQLTLTVIAPASVSWIPVLGKADTTPALHPAGADEVAMYGVYFFGPDDVSFSRMRFREQNVQGKASGSLAHAGAPLHCGTEVRKPACKAILFTSVVEVGAGTRSDGLDIARFFRLPASAFAPGQVGGIHYEIPLDGSVLRPEIAGTDTVDPDDKASWSPFVPVLAPGTPQTLTISEGTMHIGKGNGPLPPGVKPADPTNSLSCISRHGHTFQYPDAAARGAEPCETLALWTP